MPSARARSLALATALAAAVLAGCGGGSSSDPNPHPRTGSDRPAPSKPPTPSRAELKAGAEGICGRTLPLLREIRREIAADRRTVEVADTERNRFHLGGAYIRYSRVGQAETARLQRLRGPEKAVTGLHLVVNNMNPAFISLTILGHTYEDASAALIRETEAQSAEVREKALQATRTFGLETCAREFR